MFCSKCGKEIHDEAVVCIHCGCAVGGNNFQHTQQHSVGYSKFKAFQENVKTIYTLGIVSLVLCLGIGIIFQIINNGKIYKYYNKQERKFIFPEFNLKDSHEIAEYESTIRKFHSARTMTLIGYCISIALLTIGLCGLFMALMAS